MSKSLNNVKIGAIFSYILIILNSAYALVITPYIIGTLGNVEFGVYKTIASLSSSLMVLDLGIGGTGIRYIAKFKADKQDSKIPPFVSMLLGEAIILISIILITCFGTYLAIPTIYKEGLDAQQINLAKQLFFIMTWNMCFHVAENVMNLDTIILHLEMG